MKRSILFVAAFVFAAASYGQNSILKTAPTIYGNNELIRNWKFGFSVGYTQTSDSTGVFLIFDTNTANSVKTVSLPTRLKVYDFEIAPEEVYFCGSFDSAGTRYGMVGCFNIPNVYSYGSAVNYVLFEYRLQNGINYRMTCLKKMDLYLTGGYIQIAAIGDAEAYVAGNTMAFSTVCNISTNWSNWSGIIADYHNQNILFSDITATENYVTATATKVDGSEDLFKNYEKTETGFILYPIYQNLTAEIPDSRFHAIHLSANLYCPNTSDKRLSIICN